MELRKPANWHLGRTPLADGNLKKRHADDGWLLGQLLYLRGFVEINAETIDVKAVELRDEAGN